MWVKMPALMLAKCAESLALRRAFPQELSGLYTSEEMGQAEVVEVNPQPTYQNAINPTEPVYGPVNPPDDEPAVIHAPIERPLTPVTLQSMLAKKASAKKGDASPEQLGLMVSMMEWVFAPDKDTDKIRRSCINFLWGVDSSKKLTGAQIKAMLDWLKPTKNPDGSSAYSPDPMAARELKAVWEAEQLSKGQTVLPGMDKKA
jgi:hypothetical protein